jgi:methionyl aminopeptidase
VETTHLAQQDAMAAARVGAQLRSIGAAARRRARKAGFTTIANLTGHGVGSFIHETPTVATVACAGDGVQIHEGLVIAIEPFLSTGASIAHETDDGWTLAVRDASLVAQVEHTIVVTDGEPEVLTASAA